LTSQGVSFRGTRKARGWYIFCPTTGSDRRGSAREMMKGAKIEPYGPLITHRSKQRPFNGFLDTSYLYGCLQTKRAAVARLCALFPPPGVCTFTICLSTMKNYYIWCGEGSYIYCTFYFVQNTRRVFLLFKIGFHGVRRARNYIFRLPPPSPRLQT